jgi:hypothetical protein
MVSVGIFGLRNATLDLYFQKSRASLSMPPQQRLWLDNEQRLLPSSNCSCQKHQEHPIHFGACWSFDVSAEDDNRLLEKCVFCHQFGLASGKVRHRSQDERAYAFRFYSSSSESAKGERCGKVFSKASFANGYHCSQHRP